MRAIVQLRDYDPEDGMRDGEVYDPHHDPRSVINGVETEWFPGSGNIHFVDERIEEVANAVDGSVVVLLEEDHFSVDNARLVTVRDR